MSSIHSFREAAVITDMNGLRGVVASATALYALIHWEDGREEEIDQFDPRFTDASEWEWECDYCGLSEEEADEKEDDEFGLSCDHSFVEINLNLGEMEHLYQLWNQAGPRPEKNFQEPLLDVGREAA